MSRIRCIRSLLLVFVIVLFLMTLTRNEWIATKYYDHRGYLMSRNEERQFNLQEIAKALRKPHKINSFYLLEFKKEFFNFVDPNTIVITKENMNVGQEVGIYFDSNFKIRVDDKFLNLLPDELPLKKSYSTCSLVGSSGILSGSHCGKQIDRSEFVIRMNAPRLENYSADVGVKANLTTMNPSIVARRYYHLLRESDKESFLKEMKQFKTYIYIPVFSTSKGFDISINVAETFKNTKGYPIKPLFMHPDHFLATTKFWKANGITAERISSGLYMVSVAMTLCDEVYLYGFWPFHYDHNNKTVNYHYYEQGFVPLPKVHNFSEEFQSLLNLNSKGIINMHVGTCDESTTPV